jgi:hypothetical protein
MRFIVNMRYSDNVGINPETIGFGEVGLVNVANPSVTLFLPGQTFNQNPDGSWNVQYRLPAPGGSWDWTDTGTYHVRIKGGLVADTETPANTIPEHTLASYFLRFSQPKAEIATQTVTATDWRVTVRFTDDQGIDVNSLGAGDVFAANGLETIQGRSISGVVMENGNRSVRVTYSLKANAGTPWSHEDNRTNIIFSNFGHVRDLSGNLMGQEELKRYNLWFNTPAALVGPTFFNSSITATGPWEFDMKYTDNRAIDFDSIGNGDLKLQNATGYLQQATLVSKRTEINPVNGRNTIIARYRFTPGAAQWVDGTYSVIINPNQITDNQGNSIPTYVYKTMVINF